MWSLGLGGGLGGGFVVMIPYDYGGVSNAGVWIWGTSYLPE